MAGIPISSDFDVAIAEPIDSKTKSVSTFADLVNTPFPYKGMQRLVEDEESIYTLDSDLTTWTRSVSTRLDNEPTGSDSVLNMVSLTQAEYDAGTPIATTLYLITDA